MGRTIPCRTRSLPILLSASLATFCAVAFAQDTPPVDVPDLATRRGGEDWYQFLGPRQDGKSRERGILTDWRPGHPRIVWHYPLEESYGIGATWRGRYFQFDAIDGQETLLCLNSETGELLWQFSYPYEYYDLYGYNHGPRCSPVIDHDRVYIYGVAGMLHCLRVTDGQLVWKVDTHQDFGVVQNFFGVGSNPVVYEDLLLVMVGGSPPESQRVPPGRLDLVTGNGSGIVAFDKLTGQVRYKVSDDLASYSSLKIAHYDGQPWCFAFMRDALVAFDPRNGNIQFRYPWRDEGLESVNASMPVVHLDEVFISETYGPGSSLLRFRPGGFDLVWKDSERSRQKAMQTHWNTPIYHEGFLYASSGRHTANAELRCIDWKTGRVQWSEPGLTRCNLLGVDDHLVCLGEDGVLRLIQMRPDRYEEVAKLELRDPDTQRSLLRYPAWAAPILSHGLLYVRGNDRVVCLELIPVERLSLEP